MPPTKSNEIKRNSPEWTQPPLGRPGQALEGTCYVPDVSLDEMILRKLVIDGFNAIMMVSKIHRSID